MKKSNALLACLGVLLLCLLCPAALAEEPAFGQMDLVLIGDQLFLTGTVTGPYTHCGVAAVNTCSYDSRLALHDEAWHRFVFPLDAQGRYTIPVNPVIRYYGRAEVEYALYLIQAGRPIPLPSTSQLSDNAPLSQTFRADATDHDSMVDQARDRGARLGISRPVAFPPAGTWPWDNESFDAGLPNCLDPNSDLGSSWFYPLIKSVAMHWDGRYNSYRSLALMDPTVATSFSRVYKDASNDIASITYSVKLRDFSQLPPSAAQPYTGQAPADYFNTLLTGLPQAFIVPSVSLELTPDKATQRDLYEAILRTAEDMYNRFLLPGEAWALANLDNPGLYSAVNRYVLDSGFDIDFWQGVAFENPAHAPLYDAPHPYGSLAFGDTGEAVSAAQEALGLGGHRSGRSTGIYDQATQDAVKAFEKAVNLVPDGMLSPRDQMILFGTLPQDALSQQLVADGLPQALVNRWWPLFVSSAKLRGFLPGQSQDREWPVLLSILTDSNALASRALASLKADIAAGTLALGDVPTAFDGYVLAASQDGLADTAYTNWFDLLQTIQSHDLNSLFWQSGRKHVQSQFEGFYAPMQAAYDESLAYAQANAVTESQPQPTAAPIPDRPETGLMLTPEAGQAAIILKAPAGVDSYVRVYRVSRAADTSTFWPVAAAYIRGGDTLSFPLRPGIYHIHLFQGNGWQGEKSLFGPEGVQLTEDSASPIEAQQEITYTLPNLLDDGKIAL